MSELNRPGGDRYPRGGDEFGRAINFNDAVFAIALTLLSVSLAVPVLDHGGSASELWDKLGDMSTEFLSFFISFAVIGRYWFAHHQFVSTLGAVNNGWIGLNLVYLLFIALLPFPTEMLGTHFENPAALTVYAVNVAFVSGFEVLLMRRAYKDDLYLKRAPADVFRYTEWMSSTPVLTFLISIPVAYAFGTTVAALLWLSGIPIGILSQRYAPEGADEYL